MQRPLPGQRHAGKRLVDFVEVDVLQAHAGLVQRTLRGRDRGLEHDDRVMAQHAHVVDTRQRLCTQGFQAAFIHHHHGRSAVADLAGVGRADHATFLQQLDAGDAFQRRVGAHAFVLRVQLAQRTGLGTAGLHRHDLARPVLTGLRRTLVALQGIGIQLIAAQPVFARHLLGAAELAEHHTRVTLLHLFADVAAQARFVG